MNLRIAVAAPTLQIPRFLHGKQDIQSIGLSFRQFLRTYSFQSGFFKNSFSTKFLIILGKQIRLLN